MTTHSNAIAIPADAALDATSHEILRIWVTHGAGSTAWINARVLADPRQYGRLIADAIQHGGEAYAQATGGDAADVRQAILDGMRDALAADDAVVETINKNGERD